MKKLMDITNCILKNLKTILHGRSLLPMTKKKYIYIGGKKTADGISNVGMT